MNPGTFPRAPSRVDIGERSGVYHPMISFLNVLCLGEHKGLVKMSAQFKLEATLEMTM
jgi:hypothetical protein